MKVHELKINQRQLKAILKGDKTHEVRRNDRGYSLGDIMVVRSKPYYGLEHATAMLEITNITEEGTFGLPNDLVCMSVKLLVKQFSSY